MPFSGPGPFLGAQTASAYQISRSLRFRNAASAYLTRTPASAGNRKTWVWSGWVKRGYLTGTPVAPALYQFLFGCYSTGSDTTYGGFGFKSNDSFMLAGWTTAEFRLSTPIYRDPSAWMHVMAVMNTPDPTATSRFRLFINGVEVTAWTTNVALTQSGDYAINQAATTRLGHDGVSAGYYFDGYMADVNFIDTPSLVGSTNSTTTVTLTTGTTANLGVGWYVAGTNIPAGATISSITNSTQFVISSAATGTGSAITFGAFPPPTAFGAFDTNGVWQPKAYTGTYGTNGFYLKFSDNTSTTTLCTDYSGNSNSFTPTSISLSGTTYDSMIDSPTNYADGGNGRGNYAVLNPLDKYSTNTVSDGNLATNGLGLIRSTFGMSTGKWYWEVIIQAANSITGLATSAAAQNQYLGQNAFGWGYYGNNGFKYNSGGAAAYGATFTTNDIIGVAFDADVGTLTFYKNGTSQGVAYSGLTSGPYYAACTDNGSVATPFVYNFGQRPFTYTPPSGFSALNTQNLPTPTIAAGNKHFDATVFNASGSSQAVVNSGSFQPDMLWLKERPAAGNHYLADVIRGPANLLYSNATAAEGSAPAFITAFNANGFQINTSGVYTTNNSIVGWNWKAGGTGVSNTSGTITSTVSANTSAGFSVVTWTHNGSSGTIGHGLGVAPTVIIAKTRNGANDWFVYSSALGNTKALYLNLSAAAGTTSAFWNNTSPTSSVFTAGATFSTNTCVAYCFAPVSGYSSFGTYTGNGSADGTFVYLGFRPRFLILKKDGAAANWRVHDSSRSPNNLVNTSLYPNLTNAEYTPDSINEDFLSNGFKLRSADGESNASGAVYFYMAFAENPFQLARAR